MYDRLDVFYEESGLSKTVAAEKILSQFFDTYFDKPENERVIFRIQKEDNQQKIGERK